MPLGPGSNISSGSTIRTWPYETKAKAINALQRIREREAEQQARDEVDEKKYGKKRWWF